VLLQSPFANGTFSGATAADRKEGGEYQAKFRTPERREERCLVVGLIQFNHIIIHLNGFFMDNSLVKFWCFNYRR
jgi:hypothetical protein